MQGSTLTNDSSVNNFHKHSDSLLIVVATVVKRSYLVCTTPRAGSGYLCDTMWRTGFLGQPDEYFCEDGYHRDYASVDDRADISAYMSKVARLATSPNGVTGIKIMWEHFRQLICVYQTACPASEPSDIATARSLFPRTKYIWLTRENKLHQAISLYRRRATGLFYKRGGHVATAHCRKPSVDELDTLIDWLQSQDRGWQRFFQSHDISPLRVSYKEVLEDLDAVVSKIADHLRIRLPSHMALARSDYQRMSDDMTMSWIEAYERERGVCACE